MRTTVDHDLAVTWTRDELSRQHFVSSMRRYVLSSVADSMRAAYEARVRPELEFQNGREPADGPEIHRAMKRQTLFQFYSSMRTNVQGLAWRSVLPGIEREAQDLAMRAKALGDDQSKAQGTLELDPNFETPASVSALDVHLMPGCYHTEYVDGDVSMGAQYDQGLSVYFMGYLGQDHDDTGRSASVFLNSAYPDFSPRSMLDIGCTAGGNTLPWLDAYPELDIHSIDPCAPVLRYAHGRAQSKGKTVHFHQMDGADLGFPDESFDLVWSSQVLHELPSKTLRRCMAESFRVLKPGWTDDPYGIATQQRYPLH